MATTIEMSIIQPRTANTTAVATVPPFSEFAGKGSGATTAINFTSLASE